MSKRQSLPAEPRSYTLTHHEQLVQIVLWGIGGEYNRAIVIFLRRIDL